MRTRYPSALATFSLAARKLRTKFALWMWRLPHSIALYSFSLTSYFFLISFLFILFICVWIRYLSPYTWETGWVCVIWLNLKWNNFLLPGKAALTVLFHAAKKPLLLLAPAHVWLWCPACLSAGSSWPSSLVRYTHSEPVRLCSPALLAWDVFSPFYISKHCGK